MWLPKDGRLYMDHCSKEQLNERPKFRSRSPPFEGGESLCEFFAEPSHSSDQLKLFQGVSPEIIISKAQAYVFPDVGEEKLPSKRFLSLINQHMLPTDTFTKTFLQSILSSVESADPVVANAWMETLLDVIDLLPKEIIKGEILTLAINKGQISQPVSARLLCCKMLGKICTKFDPYIIKKEVLPVVLSLCQDVDFEVRGFMCRQLDTVAKGIGLEATKSAILPELVELANDEETFVRLSGIETVVQMLPMLDDGTCIQAIIPLVKKFCENAIHSRDLTLPVVSKQLGRLCNGLAANFTPEQKCWFLKFFRDLAKLGLPHQTEDAISNISAMPDLLPDVEHKDRYRDCRWACAYNFPAMVLFAEPQNFENELYNTFRELCVDPFQGVRQTMACGFFEVARILTGSSSLLFPDLVHLIQDESIEVLKGLIPYLPESLKVVCCAPESEDNKKLSRETELVKALITCEETTSVTSNWRLHADFLTRLSCLPCCVSSETIFTTFVPLLFVKLHTSRPIPCRTASAYSLLVLLRSTPSLERRKGIINELIRELCYGRSCHKRMLFIRVCELVIELFSKSFFKLYFYKPLLGLSVDPVPNIRLLLCSTFPRLKSLLKLPKDSSLLQQLESCVKTLMTDEKDRDVSDAISKAIEELDKIEVTTDSPSGRSCIDSILDVFDKQKENEERELLELEFDSKFAKENIISKLPTVKGITNTAGKIPIRKSGTLPKKSKTKEIKDVRQLVLLRTPPPSPSKQLRSIKQERRISSPGLNIDFKKDLNMSVLSSKNSSELNEQVTSGILATKTSIPVSSPMMRTWPRQKRASGIPKQMIDRCPSPMPLSRQLPERGTADPRALKNTRTIISPARKLADVDALAKGKCTKPNVSVGSVKSLIGDVSSEPKDKMTFTTLPSPVLRRSVASSPVPPNIESKIPMSNSSSSKRRSMISETSLK